MAIGMNFSAGLRGGSAVLPGRNDMMVRNAVTPVVAAEVHQPGEQVTLSGASALSQTPAPQPAVDPLPVTIPAEASVKTPGQPADPGPGIALGQGGTLLMTDTPAPEHSASIDGFLAKLRQPQPSLLNGSYFDPAMIHPMRMAPSNRTGLLLREQISAGNPYSKSELTILADKATQSMQTVRNAERSIDRSLMALALEGRVVVTSFRRP